MESMKALYLEELQKLGKPIGDNTAFYTPLDRTICTNLSGNEAKIPFDSMIEDYISLIAMMSTMKQSKIPLTKEMRENLITLDRLYSDFSINLFELIH